MTFDMQAAREICIKLSLRYPARDLIDDNYQCALAAEMLPAALDRIAELEKENLELRVAVIGPDQIRANQVAIIANQNKRIEELEAALVEERKSKLQLDASRFGMGIPEETADTRAREQLQAEDEP